MQILALSFAVVAALASISLALWASRAMAELAKAHQGDAGLDELDFRLPVDRP